MYLCFKMRSYNAQIAAIAKSHNATLATRNVADFTECDINIINPWN